MAVTATSGLSVGSSLNPSPNDPPPLVAPGAVTCAVEDPPGSSPHLNTPPALPSQKDEASTSPVDTPPASSHGFGRVTAGALLIAVAALALAAVAALAGAHAVITVSLLVTAEVAAFTVIVSLAGSDGGIQDAPTPGKDDEEIVSGLSEGDEESLRREDSAPETATQAASKGRRVRSTDSEAGGDGGLHAGPATEAVVVSAAGGPADSSTQASRATGAVGLSSSDGSVYRVSQSDRDSQQPVDAEGQGDSGGDGLIASSALSESTFSKVTPMSQRHRTPGEAPLDGGPSARDAGCGNSSHEEAACPKPSNGNGAFAPPHEGEAPRSHQSSQSIGNNPLENEIKEFKAELRRIDGQSVSQATKHLVSLAWKASRNRDAFSEEPKLLGEFDDLCSTWRTNVSTLISETTDVVPLIDLLETLDTARSELGSAVHDGARDVIERSLSEAREKLQTVVEGLSTGDAYGSTASETVLNQAGASLGAFRETFKQALDSADVDTRSQAWERLAGVVDAICTRAQGQGDWSDLFAGELATWKTFTQATLLRLQATADRPDEAFATQLHSIIQVVTVLQQHRQASSQWAEWAADALQEILLKWKAGQERLITSLSDLSGGAHVERDIRAQADSLARMQQLFSGDGPAGAPGNATEEPECREAPLEEQDDYHDASSSVDVLYEDACQATLAQVKRLPAALSSMTLPEDHEHCIVLMGRLAHIWGALPKHSELCRSVESHCSQLVDMGLNLLVDFCGHPNLEAAQWERASKWISGLNIVRERVPQESESYQKAERALSLARDFFADQLVLCQQEFTALEQQETLTYLNDETASQATSRPDVAWAGKICTKLKSFDGREDLERWKGNNFVAHFQLLRRTDVATETQAATRLDLLDRATAMHKRADQKAIQGLRAREQKALARTIAVEELRHQISDVQAWIVPTIVQKEEEAGRSSGWMSGLLSLFSTAKGSSTWDAAQQWRKAQRQSGHVPKPIEFDSQTLKSLGISLEHPKEISNLIARLNQLLVAINKL